MFACLELEHYDLYFVGALKLAPDEWSWSGNIDLIAPLHSLTILCRDVRTFAPRSDWSEFVSCAPLMAECSALVVGTDCVL